MGLSLDNIQVRVGSFELSVKHFELQPGQVGAILGESGSGKSTLLNAVSGFLPLSSGSIRVAEKSLERLPPEARGVAMVFQETALFSHLTVSENIAFGLKVQKVPAKARALQVEQWLEKVELKGLGGRYPHELSGGQAQRVALARAFIVRFPVIALDEPFAALDVGLRKGLRVLVKNLVRETGTMALLVSHDPEDVSALADTVLWLKAGKVEGQGEVAAVLPRYLAERLS